MSRRYPPRSGSNGSPPLPVYGKTRDHGFELCTGVSVRVRVFHPLWKRSLAPLVLLCWTVREQGGEQPEWLKRMVVSLREEITGLPCRASLIERFVHRPNVGETTESIHKVLEVLPEGKGSGAVLFTLGRSVLESLTGEPLDDPDERYPA